MLGFTFYKLTKKNIKELFQDLFSKLVNNIERKEGRYQGYATHIRCPGLWFQNFIVQSNQVKRTPQESINEFIIQKLNPSLVVDFRLISAFLYV